MNVIIGIAYWWHRLLALWPHCLPQMSGQSAAQRIYGVIYVLYMRYYR